MRPTAPPSPECKRVASIETQIVDDDQFNILEEAYNGLGLPNYEIKDGRSFGVKNTELRIVNITPFPQSDIKIRTILYWQVDGTSHQAIQDVYDKLSKSDKYGEFSAPATDGFTGGNGIATERGMLLEKSSNNPVGLVINPPYPRSRSGGESGSGIFGNKPERISSKAVIELVSIGVVAGLVMGWVIWLVRRRMRHQLKQHNPPRS